MEFNEIKTYLESNKESEEIKGYLKGLAKPTLDDVKSLISTEKDFKSWFDSEKDTHYNKVKEKEFPKLLETELSKRNPSETAEQKKIRELEERLNAKEKEATKKELTNLALQKATVSKLPVELIEYFIGEDEATTNSNMAKFEKVFTQAVEKILAEKGSGTYVPPKNNNNSSSSTTGSGVLDIIKEAKHRK